MMSNVKLLKDNEANKLLIKIAIAFLASFLLTFLISFYYFTFDVEIIRQFGFVTIIILVPVFTFITLRLIQLNSDELAGKFKNASLRWNNWYSFSLLAISGLLSAILLFRANELIKKALGANTIQEFDRYFYATKNFYNYGLALLLLSLLLIFIIQIITISKSTRQPILKIIKPVAISYIKFIGLLLLAMITVGSVFFVIFIIMNVVGGAPFGP